MAARSSFVARLDRTHVPMLLARVVLGGVFVRAGWHKIASPLEFSRVLREYDLLPVSPPELLNLTAIVLPWIEALCGVLLLLGLRLRAAAALVLVLTVVFTSALATRALGVHGRDGTALCAIAFDCGCGFGPLEFCAKLAENAALILLAAVATCSRSRALSLDGVSRRRERVAG